MVANIPPALYFLLLSLVSFLFLYIYIIIHEVGHAIAGLMVGFHTNSITIGRGRQIFALKIKGSRFVFKMGLGGGQIIPSVIPESERLFKLRYLIYLSGGVLAQGVVTFLVIFIFKLNIPNVINLQADIADIIDLQKITPAHLFVGINLIFIATNLFPVKWKSKGQIRSTDGYKIITLPKRKTQDLLMDMKVFPAYRLLEDKKYEAAEVYLREICQLPSPSVIPRVNLSVALIRQCKIDEAIECLEPFLEEHDKDQYASVMYNNLAWAYLLKGDKDSQQQADKYSAHALKIDPDNRIIRDSRGCILIELGAIDDGVNILEENAHLRKPVRVKPDNYVGVAYLAYASYIKQDVDTAHMYLKKVLSSSSELEPDASLIVKRIKERIMLD